MILASIAANVGNVNSPTQPLCILIPSLSITKPFSSGSIISPITTGVKLATAEASVITSARCSTLMPFSFTASPYSSKERRFTIASTTFANNAGRLTETNAGLLLSKLRRSNFISSNSFSVFNAAKVSFSFSSSERFSTSALSNIERICSLSSATLSKSFLIIK